MKITKFHRPEISFVKLLQFGVERFLNLNLHAPRVVHGDINFGILRDPLNFLFLIDLYGPYLIEFLIENGSFLLTKAHVFGSKLDLTAANFGGLFGPLVIVKRHLESANSVILCESMLLLFALCCTPTWS